MPTFHIHLEGLVQGIGFRPFIYQLATSRGMKGMVSNDSDGVHILLNGNQVTAESFLNEVLRNPPPLSRIEKWNFSETQNLPFENFSIVKESSSTLPKLHVTPDLGICPTCKEETRSFKDRRFNYAFNTCIHCGPRYSIMGNLPYDRENTVMEHFAMCPSCQEEYDDPLTRRHFSQTNSCPDCGIKLTFLKRNEDTWTAISESEEDLIKASKVALEDGKILAIKGIGGYLLVCDATNSVAVSTLRKRKRRPNKPFAVMFSDEGQLSRYARLERVLSKDFGSIESPVVLLDRKTDNDLAWEEIAPGLDTIGAMQPYTPLFVLLMDAFKKPMVATSGNTSGAPICFEDHKVVRDLGELVDGILTNNRPILVPQDDSVVRYAPDSQKRIFLRRSRGFAPSLFHTSFDHWRQGTIVSMGADLKSAFGIFYNKNTYISQYLGNLESFDSQTSFRHSLSHLSNLLKTKPNRILIDKHPAYFSNQLGKALAESHNIPYNEIQHHEAHFAAVLGENNLLDTNEKVLGVIWDGTGWGDDSSHILGSEYFLFKEGNIKKLTHLQPFPLMLGDKMAREPRLSALALFHSFPNATSFISNQFSEKEWTFYNKMLERGTGVTTSSMGRLFDAVAGLLGLVAINGYEGEAAIKLEQLARNAHQKGIKIQLPKGTIGLETIKSYCLHHLEKGSAKEAIALGFHHLLVEWIFQIADANHINKLAFSGGVFQNALLVDLIIDKAGDQYNLFFHRDLSPNDECIAFGQLCHYYLSERLAKSNAIKDSKEIINETICV